MPLDQRPKHLPRHRAAARGYKQRIVNLPIQDDAARFTQITFYSRARLFAKRHQSRFIAFAGDAQHTFIHADFE